MLVKEPSRSPACSVLLRDFVKTLHSVTSWLVCHDEGPCSFRFALHKVAYLRKDRNKLPRAKLKTLGEMDSPKLLVSLLM